jgi:hypothetical protein
MLFDIVLLHTQRNVVESSAAAPVEKRPRKREGVAVLQYNTQAWSSPRVEGLRHKYVSLSTWKIP